MKDCNNVKQSPLAGLAAYGGGSGSVIFGRKGVGGYQIERSLRFNDTDSPSLTRTFGSGNARKWTWSCWVKRNKFGGYQTLFGHVSGGSGQHYIDFGSDKIRFTRYVSSNEAALETSAVYRDPSAWYHIVAVWDTENATANHRQRLYVNGVEVTDFSTRVNPSQNYDGVLNTAIEHNIGKVLSQNYGAFQLADMHFIDGQALAPTEFGETNDDGIWDPKEFTGSFGTNGFKLDFSTNSLGQDSSGNSNNFTVNNIEATSPAATTSNITNISTSGSNQILTFTNNTGLQYFVAGDVVGTKTTTNLFSTGAGSNLNNLIAGTSSATEYIVDGNAYIQTQIWGGSGTIFFSATYASGEGFPTNSGDELRQSNSGNTSNFTFNTVTVLFADGTSQGASLASGTWTLATNGRSVRGISTELFTSFSNGQRITFNPFEIYDSGGNKRTMSIYGTGDAAVVSVAPLSSQMTVEAGNFTTGTTLSKTAVVGDDSFDSPVESTGSDTGAGAEINGNYATLNPLDKESSLTLSNGNLEVSNTANSLRNSRATISYPATGKWYYEYTPGGSANMAIGIADSLTPLNAENSGTFVTYHQDGARNVNGTKTASVFASYTADDVIGVLYDSDANSLTFYKNNSSQGSVTPTSGKTYFPFIITYNTTGSFNFGARAFAYTAPSSAKVLCTTNLPDPTIADGSTAFNIVTYTGNSTSSRAITGLNYSPDLLWIKSRSSTQWHFLADTIRGNTKNLASNATDAEETRTNRLLSFDSNGFSIGNNNTVNENNSNFVTWAWDAGANSNKTYAVKVVSDNGNKYRFDDFGTSAVTLDLEEGSTYIFDQSDSSNSGHPLRFSTTANGTHGGGTEYTTGVTVTGTPGQAGAKTTIVVAASAPTLFYYCSVHSGMGGQANTNSTAGASNFDGNIQATAKANQTAGFSIVTYSGDGSTSGSVGHGLSASPSMVIIKERNGTKDWKVAHTSLASTHMVTLNETYATGAASWNGVTSSVFYPARSGDTYLNTSGDNYIAYCFVPVEGFSAFGSYEGTGSASTAAFVFTGMRPRWIMVKNVDTGDSSTDWFIYDTARSTFNAVDDQLYPNRQIAEAATSTHAFDILSNGFKVRSTATTGLSNKSGDTYIWAAFAEHPFKTARAR